MARQSKTKKFSAPEELTRLLKDYWLVTNESPMMEIVKRAVGAYFDANRPLKVYYDDKPTVDVEPALKAIDLVADKGYFISKDTKEAKKRYDFHRVPPTGERSADFEFLLPYHFEFARRMHPSLPQAKGLLVEVAFVLWVEHLLSTGENSLVQIIDEAFCSSASGKLTIFNSGNQELLGSQVHTFLKRASSIESIAATYLGFREDCIERNDCNRFTIPALDRKHFYTFSSSVTRNLLLYHFEHLAQQNNIFCEVQDLGIVARNLQKLKNPSWEDQLNTELCRQGTHSHNDSGAPESLVKLAQDALDAWAQNRADVVEYLTAREIGTAEDVIKRVLRITDEFQTNCFLADNHISLVDYKGELNPKKIYRRWEKARKELGVAEELSDASRMMAMSSTGSTGQAQDRKNATLPTKGSTLDLPPDLKWSEVSITFVSEHTALVKARDSAQECSFRALGFEDRRKKDVPNSRWGVLLQMAKHGCIDRKSGIESKLHVDVKAAVRDVRVVLKRVFEIQDDPFEPYSPANGYRPKFRLSCNQPNTEYD